MRKKSFQLLDKNYLLIILIIFFSTILKFLYVFYGTAYQDYLVTDMGGYWFRAIERFEGNEFSINQWAIWPTFYHFFLSFAFGILNQIHLYSCSLQIILLLNIVLSSLAAYFLYLLAEQICKKKNLSLIIAGAYAFSYPFIYFNAFILSENFAIPLIIIAVWFLLKDEKISSIVFCAILLGLAVAARPSYGLWGIPFFLYILVAGAQSGFSWKLPTGKALQKGLLRSMIFSIVFFLLVGLVIAENYRISRGQLKSLAANGGINFYLAITQLHKITSNFDGYTYILIPPATVARPQNGEEITNQPIHNSDYFFRQGWNYIKSNPAVLLSKITQFPTLFFGPLMPSMGNAVGFAPLMIVTRVALFVMFLALGFSPLVFRRKEINHGKLLLIIALPVFSLLTHLIFSVEHRYLYSFAFAIYILFFLIIDELTTGFRAQRKYLLGYCAFLFVFFSLLWADDFYRKKTMSPRIKATISQDRNNLANIHQQRDTMATQIVLINNINFAREPNLQHATLGSLNFKDNFFIDFIGEFEVLTERDYQFLIYSDDGFQLSIDGKLVAAHDEPRPFEESSGHIYLARGKYRLQLSYFQGRRETGIVAYYKCEDSKDKMKADRFLIGDNSPCLQFSRQQ